MAKLSFLDLTGLTIVKDNILGIISSHTSNNDIHVSLEDRDKLNDLHTHSNKSILDATTASYTTEDKALVDTITNYLPLTGGTLSGALTIDTDNWLAMMIKRQAENSMVNIQFENGSGVLGYLAISEVDGKFKRRLGSDNSKMYEIIDSSGGTLTGNLGIYINTADWRQYQLRNSLRDMRIAVDSTGIFGFFDKTNEKWPYQTDTSGNNIFNTPTTFKGTVTVESLKKDSNTHVVLAGSTGNLNVSTVTSTALYYIRNLTGDLQEQLDNRLTLSGGGTVNAPVSMQTLTPTANSTSSSTGHTLGTSSYKWRYLYAFSSSIQTSDRRYKTNIEYISDNDVLSNVFDALQPCSFYMVGGDRKHLGLIAQDALKAMQDNGLTIDDLSFICKDHEYRLIDDSKSDTEDNREYMYDENGEPLYIYGLKYNELHALEINETQKLKKKVIDLNLALSEALARIDELERKI